MVVRDFPTPRTERFAALAATWLAAPGEGPPVRGASTVLLVRDGVAGPEVYVQRRVASMEFAPSVYVFPGGGLDPGDSSADLLLPVADSVAARMGMPPADAAAFLACAVREVAEECGVHLTRESLTVRAHWVTPPFESRRYDTWFFAAAMPPGQVASGTTTESDHARWVRPDALLAQMRSGEAVLLPPTIVMLEELAAYAVVADYLAAEPPITQVLPELLATADGFVLRAHLP